MGISRDSLHKRKLTGGKRAKHMKKRNHLAGRPSANTRIGAKRIRTIRVRGGHEKHRALRLDAGNFTWGSEHSTRKTRVLDVVYNATSNELIRTKTLVKGAIVTIDATPFRQYYETHYGLPLTGEKLTEELAGRHKATLAKVARRANNSFVDANLKEQFATGHILARIASRPGQSGRCDGVILEGRELEFYQRKLRSRK